MIDLREFAKEQENERLREMAFQEWALPRIKENFGVPGYDSELMNEYDGMEVVFSEERFIKFLEQKNK